MAKHFHPADINRENSSGYRPKQVVATLQHYGYIPSSGSKHLGFRHREYGEEQIAGTQAVSKWKGDWRLHLSAHGVVPEECTEKAASLCLAVKELNAKHRDRESLSPLPGWLGSAVPDSFIQDVEADVMRLFREPEGSPRRSYSIKNRGEQLDVVNLNFPDDFRFTFTLREGDKNPKSAFSAMFDELDAQVKKHLLAREGAFEKELGKLVADYGYIVTKDDPQLVNPPLCYLRHPGDASAAFDILAHQPHETVPNETFATLKAALERGEEQWEKWETLVDALKQKGWQVKEIAQRPKGKGKYEVSLGEDDGETRVATLVLESPSGYKVHDTIEVALYGELKIGSPGFLDACLNEVEEEKIPTSKISVSEARPLTARKMQI